MKKGLSNIVIFISLVLITIVAIPWNNLAQWGLNISFLNDNELYIKGGIGGLLFLIGLLFVFVSNKEYSNNGAVSNASANAAFLPLWMYSLGATVLSVSMMLFVYLYLAPTQTSLMILGGMGLFFINLIGFGHLLSTGFKSRNNFGRVMIYLFLLELALVSSGLAYYVIHLTGAAYAGLNTYNYILLGAVSIGIYIIHLIVLAVKKNHVDEEEILETEIREMEKSIPSSSKQTQAPLVKKSKNVKNVDKKSVTDPRKSYIVGSEQSIVSGEQGIDPTNILYEDVSIDPEFTKTANQERQVNSIDYYIEKPKMFKPLDPTFDLLVQYVREFPGVVTKITDEKITFYSDRNPFLVLMNYGNYYRIGFKYDLEKGIRLIIKYPTISKNKSTKDDLWFKANNYGDLPKEVIYQIVKTSFDNAVK